MEARLCSNRTLCYMEWFGAVIAAQVIANDGKLPLLGTELLSESSIAYRLRESSTVVRLTRPVFVPCAYSG